MSLSNLANGAVLEDVDPGFISDEAMDQLCTTILAENLTPEELESVCESSEYEGVVEQRRNIVRLNKQAKLDRAYKVGILQCAAENKDKDYKKLRKLWKMEAVLYRKLERKYKTKARARAKEAIKKTKRSNSPTIKAAGNRSAKNLGGTSKFIHSGIKK